MGFAVLEQIGVRAKIGNDTVGGTYSGTNRIGFVQGVYPAVDKKDVHIASFIGLTCLIQKD
jgi:hypothetical protein